MALVRPTPWTTTAPTVTTIAAASRDGRGREPSSSGPITASSAGTQAIATPSAAGSAYRDPSTSATLNSTRPVAATPSSQSHSGPRGQTSRRPVSLAPVSRIRQARAYRSASAVNTGARSSTAETATLPPTQTIAPAPVATPNADPLLGLGAAGALPGETPGAGEPGTSAGGAQGAWIGGAPRASTAERPER